MLNFAAYTFFLHEIRLYDGLRRLEPFSFLRRISFLLFCCIRAGATLGTTTETTMTSTTRCTLC